MKQLFYKIKIVGTMTCVTGLHIGASKENVEIGGLDLPILRRKDDNRPFVPGSSLKGKMRSLLQHAFNEPEFKATERTVVGKLFGVLDGEDTDTNNKKIDGWASPLLVRDSDLTKQWSEKLKNSDFTDLEYTEVKWENTIDRKKGTAENPRALERVPAGAEFDVEFVINVFAKDINEAENSKLIYLELFKLAIRLLENDYLGGSGSRGSGKVEFKFPMEEIDSRKEIKCDIFNIYKTVHDINNGTKKIIEEKLAAQSAEAVATDGE